MAKEVIIRILYDESGEPNPEATPSSQDKQPQPSGKKAKKETAKEYYKKMGLDMVILGLRQAEGSVRSIAFDSCYKTGSPDNYRPIWWFTDQDKEEYKRFYHICNSKCYTQYGMRRTGCAGCPFNLQLDKDLRAVKLHEPKLYKALINVFGKSHEYTEKYHNFRECGKIENKRARMKTQPLDAWGVIV